MISTDAQRVYDDFCKLEQKEMKKSMMRGMSKAAGVLRKEVRTSLRRSVRGAYARNSKYNDTLAQGVRVTKVTDHGDWFHVTVTIASSRKAGSGSYRLHFLEAGTAVRTAYIRKGSKHKPANRGRVRSYNFFESAKSAFSPMYSKVLESSIDSAVIAINRKSK